MAEKTNRVVTKRTYDRNVRKYAKAAREAFRSLLAFANKHGLESECVREMCRIVDTYSRINWDMLAWCHKSGVNAGYFACDVNNYNKE